MDAVLFILLWGLYFMIPSILRYLYRRYVKPANKKEEEEDVDDWHPYFFFRLRLGFSGILAYLTVYGGW